MNARHVFEYAALRVVPRVERGECVNAGVIVYCRGLDFLAAKVFLDADRVRALDPHADVVAIRRGLDAIVAVCEGTDGAGPAAAEPIGQRFRWLTAPRSTVIQPGPVHSGLTDDPATDLDALLRGLVLPPRDLTDKR